MADRYWVGGTGSWSSTAKWSATSGGAGGQTVPTAVDNVFFDANSGTASAVYTATIDTLAATCLNLTITPVSTVGVTQITITGTLTVVGTLSSSGTAGNKRTWIRGTTYGIATNLSVATLGTLTDIDFRDIYVVGAAAPISGTRIGDLRGIRGITASAPKTVYWNLAGAQNWSATGWATTSTGTPSTDNFPLAQDTATFTNAGSVTGTITMDTAILYTGTVDMSGRTSAMTIGGGNSFSIYGDWKNGSGTILSGTAVLTFSGRNTQIITSAGKAFTQPITVDSYGGTVELADALNIGSNALTVTNGTFDTKNYNVTAFSLTSNNTNVRTISLGSSTVTCIGNVTAVAFNTSTNMTFNAGTSTITLSGTSTTTLNGGGVTFYDVIFSSTTTNSKQIISANTFNNLYVTAPASTGLAKISFLADQTINGTFTVVGATAVCRIFVISDIPGTTRTLTVNNLSVQDCDFCDITIAGAAAGTAFTRAGDCGGNTGIAFPAAKTVYWNLAGAQNWSAAGWCPSSGGTPDINQFPLSQDTTVFDDTGSAGTVTINTSWNIGTVSMGSRTSAMTLSASSNFPKVYGDWTFGTGVTSSNLSGEITFSKRGTQTITSNGVTFGTPITINNVTGTVQLADALILNSVRTLTLNSGTFDAVTYNVTVGAVATGSGTKTLKMGSGTWTLASISTVWNMSGGATILYKGTANIVLSNTSTSARTFVGGNFSYNKLTIGGATGGSTLTINNSNQFTELASTKTVAHTLAFNGDQVFGKWTVTGTAGNVVTVTGTGVANVIAGARVSGVDYLAMGTIGFAATSPGEFYAGANSTGTNATIIKTAAPAAVTRYWVGGTGTWDATTTTKWSATSGGAGGASVPTSADAVVFNSASNATAYTVTCTATQLRCGSLTMAGPASGNVTWAGTAQLAIHDNVTLPATGLTRSYTGLMTLSGSATGRTLTTNGVTLGSQIDVNGVNCGWLLGSAANTSNSLIVTNGSFNTGSYSFSVALIRSDFANTRSLSLGSSVLTFGSTGSFPIDFGTAETNRDTLTFSAGTSQINDPRAAPVFNGNNKTFYDYAFTSTAAITAIINGVNTFNNLSFAGRASTGITTISLSANQTINGTLTLSAGTNATMRTNVQSDIIGTTRTLTCAAFSGTDVDFRDITIDGAAAPVSGTRLGDCKGNSGITFDAAKTVWWNLTGNNNWSATAWATSAGGTPAVNNFPLAQDTAIFTSTSPGSGAVITLNQAYNFGTIDMSSRTANTMVCSLSVGLIFVYGNVINGAASQFAGAASVTFSGRNTQTITYGGSTFFPGVIVNSPSGTVQLIDNLTTPRAVAGAVTLTNGTLDLNGKTLSLSVASGTFLTAAGTKTLAFNGGVLNVFTSGGSFNNAAPTGLTVTGTGTISLTNAAAKNFVGGNVSYSGITLNQGGAGALTISGNNTFANITNTSGVATSILLGNTTQTVGTWDASGAAGQVLTVSGTSATSPATLIVTGTPSASLDYMTITGVRAYPLETTWYAGANSTNNGSLGWYFAGVVAIAVSAFFLLF